MKKMGIRIVIGIVTLVTLFALLGCDEDGGPSPAIRATRQEGATFTVGEAAVIDADTSNGEIIVLGIEGTQEVHVVATLRSRGDTQEEAEERLDKIVYHATQDGQTILLQYKASEQDRDVRRWSGVDFEVTVPVATRVDADTSNGAISVEGVSGRLDLDTSNGAITVLEVTGEVFADTSNGRISMWEITGDVHADTSNGRIELERIAGDVRAETSNGDIELESIDGEVDADTSNGRIHYEGGPVGTNNSLRTSNGSITVRIPVDASVAFEVDAKEGSIRSSLPLTGDTEGDYWKATLNPPATTAMSLRTSNGAIRIDRLP